MSYVARGEGLIYALDPGVLTGIACGEKGRGKSRIKNVKVWQFDCHEELRAAKIIATRLHHRGAKAIVVEDFRSRQPNGSYEFLTPVRLAGMLAAYADVLRLPELTMQQTSCKGVWTDKRLKNLGLWIPGRPHGMDALRHLLYYLHR